MGYSPTGEVFNLNSLDLARAVACEVKASKLILMTEPPGVVDGGGTLARQITVRDAREFTCADAAIGRYLDCAIRACQSGVGRVHIVERNRDGVLIEELFTRDGIGTLVSNTPFDQLHKATIEDVGGILGLIEPLEQEGSLVKRSREKLEIEIDHFSVIVREGVVVACGALYPFANGVGEIACIAVHSDYRRDGFGNVVLGALERRAAEAGLQQVFVLTTQATHWFQENGYVRAEIQDLPIERQGLYNFQRNSVVLLKQL
jgi:amino-acid N-acetyltransferase